MANCKSCGKPFQIQAEGYHSGLCQDCKELSKAFMMADPAFARIATEYGRRYGRIWTD